VHCALAALAFSLRARALATACALLFDQLALALLLTG